MPGAAPGRLPGTAGGRGAPGTPPGRAGALAAPLGRKGLFAIRGGRGAPGTAPGTRAGRAGVPGVAVPPVGRSAASAGRASAASGGAAAVKVGPTDGVSVRRGCSAGRAGGAAGTAGRAATTGAGADPAVGDGVATSAIAGVTLGALGTGRPGAPGREDGLRGAAVAVPPPSGSELLVAAEPFDGAAAWEESAGKASRNFRTTGASIVDEALLTNSPNSFSLEMISLLDLPSSFASSCTRALPATALLTVRPGGKTARPRVSCTGSLLGLHGVLTTVDLLSVWSC